LIALSKDMAMMCSLVPITIECQHMER